MLMKLFVQGKNKTFFKQGDLISKQTEEILKKIKVTPKEDGIDERKSQNDCGDSQKKKSNMTEAIVLERSEVIRRLRDRGEPILIFGECDIDSFKRLRKLEIHQPETNRGFRNDFQEAMDQVDQAYLDEILNSESQTQNARSQKKTDNFDLDDAVEWEEIEIMAKTLGKTNKDYDMHVITLLFQHILKLWNNQLSNSSPHDKMSVKLKTNRVIFTQTKEYMKPLFRKLKNRTLPEDILESLVDISKNLVNRNYIAASDSYLEMAIGNAPWPIGVTMVGIHARTGREKIFSKNVAHVMNDETQRKYIQGLKRLMTKCQECFPTDPSRCVEYVPNN